MAKENLRATHARNIKALLKEKKISPKIALKKVRENHEFCSNLQKKFEDFQQKLLPAIDKFNEFHDKDMKSESTAELFFSNPLGSISETEVKELRNLATKYKDKKNQSAFCDPYFNHKDGAEVIQDSLLQMSYIGFRFYQNDYAHKLIREGMLNFLNDKQGTSDAALLLRNVKTIKKVLELEASSFETEYEAESKKIGKDFTSLNSDVNQRFDDLDKFISKYTVASTERSLTEYKNTGLLQDLLSKSTKVLSEEAFKTAIERFAQKNPGRELIDNMMFNIKYTDSRTGNPLQKCGLYNPETHKLDYEAFNHLPRATKKQGCTAIHAHPDEQGNKPYEHMRVFALNTKASKEVIGTYPELNPVAESDAVLDTHQP